MRGDKEEACLKYVSNHISEAFFPEMEKDEQIKFIKALVSAIPNDSASEFPDFIIANGFIEHFEINASRETSKGSAQRIEESKFERNCLTDISAIPQTNTSSTLDIYSMAEKMNPIVYTRDDFIRSFKKHFEKHIVSLRSYKKCTGYRIFLIENSGATFKVMINGCYCNEIYRPSFDYELLNYIYLFNTDLTHIVFRSAQIIEVISLDKLPNLISRINSDISFETGRFNKVKNTIIIDV